VASVRAKPRMALLKSSRRREGLRETPLIRAAKTRPIPTPAPARAMEASPAPISLPTISIIKNKSHNRSDKKRGLKGTKSIDVVVSADGFNTNRHETVKVTTEFATLTVENTRTGNHNTNGVKTAWDGVKFDTKRRNSETVNNISSGDKKTNRSVNRENKVVINVEHTNRTINEETVELNRLSVVGVLVGSVSLVTDSFNGNLWLDNLIHKIEKTEARESNSTKDKGRSKGSNELKTVTVIVVRVRDSVFGSHTTEKHSSDSD
jgi:hypothetical protein